MPYMFLFILGYLIGMIGSARIVYGPIKSVMCSGPDVEADAGFLAFTVAIGVATLWPLAMPLYAMSRRVPAPVD